MFTAADDFTGLHQSQLNHELFIGYLIECEKSERMHGCTKWKLIIHVHGCSFLEKKKKKKPNILDSLLIAALALFAS